MATLLPNAVQQFADANGVPIAGGSVYFYIPNTTTPKDTWSDSGGTILNTNPIVLNASGENPAGGIYGSGSYRQVVYDALGNLIWDHLTADTSVGGLAWGGISSGTANAQVIAASSFSSQDGQQISFLVGPGLTNTGALTVAPGGGSQIPVLKDITTGPTPLTGDEVGAGNAVTLIYDAARGAFHLVQNDNAEFTRFILTFGSVPVNFSLAVAANSPSANQLTVSIKTLAGTDPTTSNPIYIPFRDSTASNGIQSVLSITAPVTFTLSAGSTIGTTSAVIAKLWIGIFNNSGSPALGLVNCFDSTTKSIMALRDGLASSTAEGGSGGADSARVIYTTASISNQPFVLVGYMEITEGTAGQWATAPSLVQVLTTGVSLPGEPAQSPVRIDTGTVSTGSTAVPLDNTIPQSGEGKQFMTLAITPFSGANLLNVKAEGQFACASLTNIAAFLLRDSGTDALVTNVSTVAAGALIALPLNYVGLAGSASSTTFKVNAGGQTAVTITFNGNGGSQLYGGTMNSFIEISEIST